MPNINEIIESADMIVNGYAFTVINNSVRVFNLNNSYSACVYSSSGEVIETNMNGIESQIVDSIWQRNSKFLDADYA